MPSIVQLEEFVAKAESLLKARDQSGARGACKEALALAALDGASLKWLATADGVLWRLWIVAYQSGDIRSAYAAVQAVHRHRLVTMSDDHTNLQRARECLAIAKFSLGDRAGAVVLQEKVHAVRLATLPDDHPDLQRARHNLANTKRRIGDLPGALELQEKVLAVMLDTLPDNSPEVQVARGNLAVTKATLGDLSGALALQEKVLAVKLATLPDDHLDLQRTRHNVAILKGDLGDLSGARVLQEKVLAVMLATLPDDHLDLQSARENLANIKWTQGDLAGALALQEKVLAVLQATLSDNHSHLQSARSNLAATKATLGDLSGALVLQEKVLAVRQATLPDDHLDLQGARHSLANIKWTQGDLAGALELQEKVLAVMLAKLPDDHLDLQGARQNLANTKFSLGDLPGALVLQEKVLAVRVAKLPDDHADVQAARNNLANTKWTQGDLAGALVLQEKVLAVELATLPDDHPDLQNARLNLANTKGKMGDLAGAMELQEKALAVLLTTLPDDHPNLQRARGNLAVTVATLGDLPGALVLQEKVLAVCQATLPNDHPSVQSARGSLAATKLALGDYSAALELHRAAVVGAMLRLSMQVVSLRSIVQLASQATHTISGVASLLDLGNTVSAQGVRSLCADGLGLLEAKRSAPLHLSRMQQSIRSQHPDVAGRLLRQLAMAGRRINDAVALPAEDYRGTDGKRVSRDDAIREAVLEKDRLEREWLALIPPGMREAPDATKLAKALAQDEVAISFCRYTRSTNDPDRPWVVKSEERYGAFLLRSSGDVIWHSLAATDKVDALIKEVRDLAVHRRTDRAGLASLLTELRRLLLDPVLAAVPDETRSLVLSLADEMHLLPLGDMPLASGKLLGDEFSVRSVWALRSLLQAPRNRPSNPSALVVGDPDYDAKPSDAAPVLPENAAPIVEALERGEARAVEGAATTVSGHLAPSRFGRLLHAKREIKNIEAAFKRAFAGSTASTLLAASASEPTVVAQAPGMTFIHFVTHGYLWPSPVTKVAGRVGEGSLASFDMGRDHVAQLSPYSMCGIALTGFNRPADELGRREGLFTAQEIAGLDLGACYLTTLSACQTSLGVRQAGSGLASLRQAFHAAGVRFVLATLWEVDDENAAELMTEFYSRVWRKGEDPHTALRAAKAKVRKRGAPFRDWGGWVLTGR